MTPMEKRNAAARALGYPNYYAARKARAAGKALPSDTRAQPKKIVSGPKGRRIIRTVNGRGWGQVERSLAAAAARGAMVHHVIGFYTSPSHGGSVSVTFDRGGTAQALSDRMKLAGGARAYAADVISSMAQNDDAAARSDGEVITFNEVDDLQVVIYG